MKNRKYSCSYEKYKNVTSGIILTRTHIYHWRHTLLERTEVVTRHIFVCGSGAIMYVGKTYPPHTTAANWQIYVGQNWLILYSSSNCKNAVRQKLQEAKGKFIRWRGRWDNCWSQVTWANVNITAVFQLFVLLCNVNVNLVLYPIASPSCRAKLDEAKELQSLRKRQTGVR